MRVSDYAKAMDAAGREIARQAWEYDRDDSHPDFDPAWYEEETPMIAEELIEELLRGGETRNLSEEVRCQGC